MPVKYVDFANPDAWVPRDWSNDGTAPAWRTHSSGGINFELHCKNDACEAVKDQGKGVKVIAQGGVGTFNPFNNYACPMCGSKLKSQNIWINKCTIWSFAMVEEETDVGDCWVEQRCKLIAGDKAWSVDNTRIVNTMEAWVTTTDPKDGKDYPERSM